MDVLAAHGDAIGAVDALVRPLDDDAWAVPTPDSDWTVRDLVNHLTVEQLWAPELLAGRWIEDVGTVLDGDVLGDDPVDRWVDASVQAREAFLAPGALERRVHLSYGDESGAEYCAQLTFDLVVHAWDLARATGAPEDVDPALVAWSLHYAQSRSTRDEPGRLLRPLDVADDADDLARLLALTGRSR
ncbi:TIGR03086 family metal-binding protein [Cellulosimicrobium composti]|uniref:TIGR03086 family protein n=1 Tax=Cellulosimicrobium composti TaxID=2672572 RepID=A0ABX0B8V2_9MICO|nr:TIGR03086 family metal-binding protein [Cellulosimicrobium composti]NDO88412.1 TIGR03086 family protein [Cellulosimicrobium composti]